MAIKSNVPHTIQTLQLLTSANHLNVASCHNTWKATVKAIPQNDIRSAMDFIKRV